MFFERTYRRGDAGPAVAEVRAKLAVLGLLQASLDPLAESASARVRRRH